MTNTFPFKVRRSLTIDDRLQIGSTLAVANAKIVELTQELKQIKGEYKSRVITAESLVQQCQEALNRGWRMTDIACYWQLDYPTYGSKSIIRTDTGETVQTEAMSNADRQDVLVFEGEKQDAEAEVAAMAATDAEPCQADSKTPADDSVAADEPQISITGPDGETVFSGTTSDLKEVTEFMRQHPEEARSLLEQAGPAPLVQE